MWFMPSDLIDTVADSATHFPQLCSLFKLVLAFYFQSYRSSYVFNSC